MSNIVKRQNCNVEETITMTREELNALLVKASVEGAKTVLLNNSKTKAYVGLKGIQRALECSKTTAWRIKKSGVLESFLRYRGNTYVVTDPDALRDKVDYLTRKKRKTQ